jgi:hypothetical protein
MKPRLCVLLMTILWIITNLHALLYLSPTSIYFLFPLFCATHLLWLLPYSKAFLFWHFISDLMVFTEVGWYFWHHLQASSYPIRTSFLMYWRCHLSLRYGKPCPHMGLTSLWSPYFPVHLMCPLSYYSVQDTVGGHCQLHIRDTPGILSLQLEDSGQAMCRKEGNSQILKVYS